MMTRRIYKKSKEGLSRTTRNTTGNKDQENKNNKEKEMG